MATRRPSYVRQTSTNEAAELSKPGFMTAQDAQELADLYQASAAKDTDLNADSLEWMDTDLDNAGKVTEYDKFDMTRMGKKQELRRVFRQFSILSFTCVIMATWE